MNSQGHSSTLIRQLWHYCNVLRDDGLSYPDYVEQLTYLLFLKMAEEQGDDVVPTRVAWRSFASLEAPAMHQQYSRALHDLGGRGGMLGAIFRNARNKIRDPAKLRLLVVELIGSTQWTGFSTDVKGDAYEGLLEKNARDTKSGAGQYFTPRPLIEAIVDCIDPRPGEVICDPACGTGGFLLAAYRHVRQRSLHRNAQQESHLLRTALRGVELVEEVARLATMNLLLHGIQSGSEGTLPIQCYDSLKEPPEHRVDVVLTNPPFGIKGSVSYGSDGRKQRRARDLTIVRPDFWVQTANKQLNFVQHVVSLLKPNGRAAVVIPDNVLFEEGGAAFIRRRLLETCDVQALLRLPAGLFYAQSVKANVVFFSRCTYKRPPTRKRVLWVYDLRSEHRFSFKTNPLQRHDLEEFVSLFRSRQRRRGKGSDRSDGFRDRWRAFAVDALLATEHCNLDISWQREAVIQRREGLSRLEEISKAIAEDLQTALAHLAEVSGR